MKRALALATIFGAVCTAAAAADGGGPSPGPSWGVPGCASALPLAPSGLPAPLFLRTTCGTYRVGEDGGLGRTGPVRSPSWSPSRFRIGVQNGHVVVFENGRLRWRSQRAFASESDSEFDSAAFNARTVAFSFVHGRLWVSRLDGRERAVGWSEGAMTWTNRGDLLTLRRRHGHLQLALRDRDGLHPRVVARRPVNYLCDDTSRTVVFVTASGSLVRTDGRSKQRLADLRSLGFAPRATLQALPRNMTAISSRERLTILRGDGSIFAAIDYPPDPAGLTHGWPVLAVAGDRVAAAVELERPQGGTAGEDLYVLEAGDAQSPRLARLEDHWAGCGWLVTMVWHGDWLLYSDSAVDVLAIDTSRRTQVDLSKAARQLPGVHLDDNSGEYTGLDFAAWG
jgi:hypothetical protein